MGKHKSKTVSKLLLTYVLCLIAIPAFGQTSGKLKGRVVDVLGGAIPKVTVTIKSLKGKNQVVTDEDGEFEIQLPVGIYEIRTEKLPGFLRSKYARLQVKRDKDNKVTIKVMHTLNKAECILRVTTY